MELLCRTPLSSPLVGCQGIKTPVACFWQSNRTVTEVFSDGKPKLEKTPRKPPPTSSLKSQIIKKKIKLCGKYLVISETASQKKCEAGEKLERHLDVWETPASPRAPASCCHHPLFLPAPWTGSCFSSIKLSALVQLQTCPCLASLKAWDTFPSDLASSKALEESGSFTSASATWVYHSAGAARGNWELSLQTLQFLWQCWTVHVHEKQWKYGDLQRDMQICQTKPHGDFFCATLAALDSC